MNTFDSELTFGTSSVYVGCFSSQIIWAWACQRSPMSRGSRKNKLVQISPWLGFAKMTRPVKPRNVSLQWSATTGRPSDGSKRDCTEDLVLGRVERSFFQQIRISHIFSTDCNFKIQKELQLPLCSNQASMQKGPTTKKHCYFCTKSPARKGALMDSLPHKLHQINAMEYLHHIQSTRYIAPSQQRQINLTDEKLSINSTNCPDKICREYYSTHLLHWY